MRAACLGGGVIGGGWVARFLLNGWDVAVFDPDPQAERKLGEVLSNARRSLPALYDRALPAEGRLTFAQSPGAAVEGADWVQESVPERLDLKHRVYRDIAPRVKPGAVLASSTSGFKPGDLNSDGASAIVAHPFNPVYLLPLVELVGDRATCETAAHHLRAIGMFPLTLRREIDAHIADRLLEAVWRESLWLVKDGIATTADIDEAIRMGFGLRWAQMGLFETYRIAGGEAGMRHFMQQFGPALEWPWTKLTDVPDFTPELVDLIAGQSDAQSGHVPIRDLERLRDDNLVGIMRALKKTGSGAGRVIRAHEAALPGPQAPAPAVTLDRQVPRAWVGQDGRMAEAQFLDAASAATGRFMEMIGADAAYVAAGRGFVATESRLRYLAEVQAGDRLRVKTRLSGAEGGRLRVLHDLSRGDGTPAATVETLLTHVDLATRQDCPPTEAVRQGIARFMGLQTGPGQSDGARRHADRGAG